LPVSLTADGDGLQYLYDVKDTRIYKENDGADKEYYLQDANGKTVGIYNITGTDWSWYAYGKERIVKFGSGGTKEFFEYDHLGNTRVTFSTTLNCLTSASTFTINNAVDYYPYGKILRSFAGTGLDRYGYQSSEREPELGDNDYYTLFRGLDADIARWKQIDPKPTASESPYASMGCNPVSKTDVNGDTPGDGDKNCVTCRQKEVKQPMIANDNTGLAPRSVPSLAKAAPGSGSQSFVSQNNSSPAVQQIQAFNATTLANGGSGSNISQQVTYGLGQALNTINNLPATVTLPMMALSPAGLGGLNSLAAPAEGRVFWSGGKQMMNEAANFAASNGGVSLEMTAGGKMMSAANPYLPNAISEPLWNGLSSGFARGASGPVTAIQSGTNGVRIQSVWAGTEFPILQNKNPINYITK
jgi:RHS repeat-associated protein